MTGRKAAGPRRCVVLWAGWALVLNLGWELAQLPLYTIYQSGSPGSIAFAVAHCTAGDVIISLACYGVGALATRSLCWPVERPARGAAAAIPTGVLYTIFSEWLNVSVRGSWQYAPAMPTLSGIGVAPLLQWLVVPFLILILERHRR